MSLSNRRFKVIAVDPIAVLMLLAANAGAPPYLVVANFPSLPEGIEFQNVTFDSLRNCFVVLVSHPDWPEVEVGCSPEVMACEFTSGASEYANVALMDEKIREMYREAASAVFRPKAGEVIGA